MIYVGPLGGSRAHSEAPGPDMPVLRKIFGPELPTAVFYGLENRKIL